MTLVFCLEKKSSPERTHSSAASSQQETPASYELSAAKASDKYYDCIENEFQTPGPKPTSVSKKPIAPKIVGSAALKSDILSLMKGKKQG